MTDLNQQDPDPLNIFKKKITSKPAAEQDDDPLGIFKKKREKSVGSVESSNTGPATPDTSDPYAGLDAKQKLKKRVQDYVQASQMDFNNQAVQKQKQLQAEVAKNPARAKSAGVEMQQFLDDKEKEYNASLNKWFNLYNDDFEREDFEENKETNPFYNFGKTAWTTLTKDIPASFFGTRALVNSTFNKMDAQIEQAAQKAGIQLAPTVESSIKDFITQMGSSLTGLPKEQFAQATTAPVNLDKTGREMVIRDVKKAMDLSQASAEQKKYLVNSLDKVKDGDYIDWLNYAASAAGQGVGQIPASLGTKGATSLVQQMGNIYMDSLRKIAQDESDRKGREVTIEEVIRDGKDDVVYPLLAGIGSGLLDAVGARGVASVGKQGLLNAFRRRALALGAVGSGLKEAGTEGAQSIIEQIGVNKAAGQTWSEALASIDPKQIGESALQGGLAGLFMAGAGSALRTIQNTGGGMTAPIVEAPGVDPVSAPATDSAMQESIPEEEAVPAESPDVTPEEQMPAFDEQTMASPQDVPVATEESPATTEEPVAATAPEEPIVESTPVEEAVPVQPTVEQALPVAEEVVEPAPAPKKKVKKKPSKPVNEKIEDKQPGDVSGQESAAVGTAGPSDTELPVVQDNAPASEERPTADAGDIQEGKEVDFEWLGERRRGTIIGKNDRGLYRIKYGKTTLPVEPEAVFSESTPKTKDQKHQERVVTPRSEEDVVVYNAKRKKPIGIVSNGNGFMMQTDLGGKIDKFVKAAKNTFQKEFVPRGFLPMDTFKRWHQANAEIAKHAYTVDTTVRDAAKSIKKFYGKKLTNADVTEMNRYLSGNKNIDLPNDIKQHLDVMRAQVDNMSRDMIQYGVVSGPMVETFTKNLGSYLRRSYRKYDDPEWAQFVPEEIRNKAFAFIRQNAQYNAQRKFTKATKMQDRARNKQALIDKLNKRIERLSKPFENEVNDRITPNRVREVINEALPKVIRLRDKIKNVSNKDYDKLYKKWKREGEKAMSEGRTEDAMAAFTKATRNKNLGDTKAARIAEMQQQLKELEKPFDSTPELSKEKVREIVEDRYARIEKIRQQIQNIEARDLESEAEQALVDAQKAYNISNEEVEGLINYILYNPDSPAAGLGKGGKLGSKDLSILQRRGEIAPEIRALLGEYSDPLLNYARSIMGMANLTAKHRFLEDTKAEGLGKWLFTAPIGEYSAPIAAQGSKTMSPLNLYTKPEIADAFNSFLTNDKYSNAFLRAFAAANAWVKSGKTVLSPITQVGNVLGNIYFMVGNGYAFGGTEIATGAKVTPKAVFSAIASNYTTDQKVRDYYKHLVDLGVVRNGAASEEFKKILSDIRAGKDTFDRLLNGEPLFNRVRKKIFETATNVYQAGDDMFKIIGFEVEKARYHNAFPEKSDAEIEKIAADIITHVLPTYSRTPKIVQRLRVNPIMGAFVSFPAEVLRTTGNTYQLAFKELRDSRTRAIGSKRLAGILTANTLSTLLKLMGMAALGMSWEDDEKFRKVTAAPWNGNSEYFYLGREGADYRVMDLSFRDPYAMLKRPLYDLLDNEDPMQGAVSAMGDLVQPFISEDILFSKIVDWERNQQKNGRQVYNPDDWWGDQVGDIWKHFADAFEPGAVRFYQRLKKGINKETDIYGNKAQVSDALFELTGQRIEKRNVEQSFQYKVYDIKDRIGNTKTEFNRQVLKLNATEEDIEKATKRFEYAMRAITKDANDLFLGAVSLGASVETLEEMIYAAGEPFIEAAIDGTVEEYLSDYKEAKGDDREEKLEGDE